MQILRGTKRDITLAEWNEKLEKAKKRLEESKRCYELYGDDGSKQWIAEDEQKVSYIEQQIKEVIAYMDEHSIR